MIQLLNISTTQSPASPESDSVVSLRQGDRILCATLAARPSPRRALLPTLPGTWGGDSAHAEETDASTRRHKYWRGLAQYLDLDMSLVRILSFFITLACGTFRASWTTYSNSDMHHSGRAVTIASCDVATAGDELIRWRRAPCPSSSPPLLVGDRLRPPRWLIISGYGTRAQRRRRDSSF